MAWVNGLKAKDRLKAEVDVLLLLRLRAQLKQQAAEYSAALRAGRASDPEGITEENFIMNATQDLERDLEEIKISYQNKALALQRIQIASALRNKVKHDDDDSRVIMETLKCIVMLSKAVTECQQQVHEKEQKLIDLKKRRLSLKKAGEEKLLQVHILIKKIQDEQESMAVDSMLEKIHDNLRRERHMAIIIQNVFQSIIMASRVNWAEDPSLKTVVLNLEKNACLL